MKKIGKIIFIITLWLACIPFNIKAASASISVKTNKSQTVVGSNVTVTVTISSQAALGAWQFDVNYDTSKLQLLSQSDTPTVVESADSTNRKSKTYTYYFKTKAAGTATVSIGSSSVLAYEDESAMQVSNGSTSIRIITQAELEASYSKNNYLSSLSVEGVELSPSFNKETLEYTVDLEPETTSIRVNATKEDAKASIEGAGDIAVSEGENRITINVTAENGNVRTYIIKANVKELSPINLSIEGKPYTVVRKQEFLTAPSGYTATTTMIEGEEVPAFTSEITGYTLIGLKNEEGIINLYIYDMNKGTYTLYKELSFDRIVLFPMEFPNDTIKEFYIQDSITINDETFIAYRIKKDSAFALLYGENVLTGEKGVYVYDTKEHTLQRYNQDEASILKENIDQYEKIIIVLIGLLAITLLSFIIFALIKKSSQKKSKNKKQKNKKKTKQQIEMEQDKETEEPMDQSFL